MSSAARADSDGYYCVGPNYLAYQFGFNDAAHPPRVFVVRYGGAQGISVPASIDLPPFQAGAMQCDGRAVRMLAYDALYTIQLDTALRPASFTRAAHVPGTTPAGFAASSANLGIGNSTVRNLGVDTVPLLREASGVAYLLEVSADPAATRRCDLDVRARIVRIDASRRELGSLWLPRGSSSLAQCIGPVMGEPTVTDVGQRAPPVDGLYVQAARTRTPTQACFDPPRGFVEWSELATATLGVRARNPDREALKRNYSAEYRFSELGYETSVSAELTALHWALIDERGVHPFAPTSLRGTISYSVNAALNVLGAYHSGGVCGAAARDSAAFAIGSKVPISWSTLPARISVVDSVTFSIVINREPFTFARPRGFIAPRSALVIASANKQLLFINWLTDRSTCANNYSLFSVTSGSPPKELLTNRYHCDP